MYLIPVCVVILTIFTAGFSRLFLGELKNSALELLTAGDVSVDAATAELNRIYGTSIKMLMTGVVLIFVVIVGIGFAISRSLTTALDVLKKDISWLINRDFTHKFNEKLLSRNDDFGILAQTIEKMRADMAELIGHVNSPAWKKLLLLPMKSHPCHPISIILRKI